MTTDPLSAHKALIEAALAELAKSIRDAVHNNFRGVHTLDGCDEMQAAVAGAVMDTLSSTLARWAAIGEAVERLEEALGDAEPPFGWFHDDGATIYWQGDGIHVIRERRIGPRKYVRLGGSGPTLPAAIAAALGSEP